MKCRICSSDTNLYVIKNGYEILKCVCCGFGQVDVTAEEISEYYDKAYFDGEKAHFAQPENCEIPRSHQYWIERNLRRLPKRRDLRILEIGPGLGAPIAGYIKRMYPKFAFAAVEISEYASDRLATRGFEIFRGRITDNQTLDACRGRYDLVYGTEVIEHDPEPLNFLRAVHQMLRPGGWAAFTTGNINGGISRWNKERCYYFDPPAHVSYYNPKAVKIAFRSENFINASVACYGFNYINLKLKTHLPGILALTHLSRISTGMSIAAQRPL